MKKINIAIAAEDGVYLKQLTNYLVKSEHNFEVASFTKRDSLLRFLQESGNCTDILLLCEDMLCAELTKCEIVCKILLTEDGNSAAEGYHSIKKYQKTANLFNEALLCYGKDSGKSNQIVQGTKSTQFIGVYSPVGGSGKSTLALLTAQHMSKKGKKVFYQNFERINSVYGILPAVAQMSCSDLLVSVRAKEKGIGISLLSGMCSDPKLGFSYINPPDSSLEFNEVTLAELMTLLNEIRQISRFDAVVLDFDSELTEDKIEMLEYCDKIIVPFLPDSLSLNKLKSFWRELELREELFGLKEKLIYVANRLGAGMERYLEQCGVFQKCTPAAMLPLSGRLANIGQALADGNGVENELELLTGRLG